MKKLWILLILALILSLFADYREAYFHQQKKHEKLFTFLLITMLATFCGLRTWYNDTVTYLQIYEQTTSLKDFWTSSDAIFANGFGFGLLNCILKDLGFSSQDFLMFYAYITVIPYVLFVKKYCVSFPFGIFLMFTTGMYAFTFAAIKQCTATAICLIAASAAIDRKWIKYFFLVFIASLFHPYSIIYLLVPLMFFRPWTYWTFVYTVIFIFVGLSLERILGTIVDVTAMIGGNYSMESFIGEGVNIFRVLVAFVPFFLGMLYRRQLFSNSTRSENFFFNLAMLNALIMFVGLFGTANYFARLANYFLPAQVIILPWLLEKINGYDRKILKPTCVVCYLGYFIYENGILKNFDNAFSQTTLWNYLSSHF